MIDRGDFLYGTLNSALVCPHCREKGHVRTRQTKRKAGIRRGKAAGTLLTGALSVFATVLSRKERLTEAHCSNCNSTWHF